MILYLVLLFCSSEGIWSMSIDEQVRCSDGRQFPDDFLFGASTAAFQIEGAWNIGGRTPSIWDVMIHNSNGTYDSGDVACDSYHNVLRDVAMIKDLGLNAYRFSISWTRVLPTGFSNEVNSEGIAYYNLLIDELLKINVTPVVTIYHWDLPQSLQQYGGFLSDSIVDRMTDFADVLFKYFGDRVKMWITINEPDNICDGYSTHQFAPQFDLGSGIADYICAKNILLAHASIYHLYDTQYRPSQDGKVGLAYHLTWYEALSSNEEDQQALVDYAEFSMGIYVHPIFGEGGDFPEVVKTRVHDRSIQQGYRQSRLPSFTPEQVEFIKGTADYFGFNEYTTQIVKRSNATSNDDIFANTEDIPFAERETNSGFTAVPWGMYKLLRDITARYSDPDIYIFENGYSSDVGLGDPGRVHFIRDNLKAVLNALEDGSKIKGFFIWSLMDNLEWSSGYKARYGLFEVDFQDPKRPRTKRQSAYAYANIIQNRTVDYCFVPEIKNDVF